uniref:Solute carrier family 12 member 9 n=1 Tax=Pelodiscus sinensis TaxID=13735 RepID=K7FL73_PELSI|nr:solute carrier family 12 member 9 isoform X1 [Pelodiscus sinensis]XP_006112151.1 solute carrier family 12 member 9 isoform X1 [Pelodiscus sinensis]XP_006112152.1 solute carrier family 12 member 9 isoform X1 [Pelodiscus sinensis]XP_006112153.1 solute carrier family 12 member 9 isoform X1 [Pelodiscus sinensis]|eukprot:XP_006112150.1 solute carrier family 12 member 9 isoform X1 [Pelodiscus sinensis]
MSTESSPLLSYRLFSVVDEGEMPSSRAQEEAPLVGGGIGPLGPPQPDPARRLSTFFGVVVPTVLSMFSIVVFMRVGFVVGHAGFLQSLLMLVVAYVIILLTVLSVCAICTNGAIQGGGAYFMISRTLGPEFGGSIGLMFYLANVCACGVYVLGLVEAVLDVFGADGTDPPGAHALPQGYFYSFLYGSLVLLLCLLVCLVGARIYARAAFLIFLVVNLVLLAIFLSFFVVGPRPVPVARDVNHTFNTSFTGFRLDTLRANLHAMYSRDYTTNNVMTFATVFAVMFNGCTGIMAGSNMSGELRNPSSSIPKGTIIAVVYTFVIYFLLFFMTSFTCERTLLKEDYGFFRSINLWPPLVLVGVYAASLSASMSSLIGASRILHALAKDDLFGIILAPAKIVSKGGNPWVAVLYTWALVQVVLFAGKLNTIAGIVTVFYLVAYAAVDLACLLLEWASAPNFRPTFQLFSWHSCLLGIASCLLMMFLISPAGASGSLVLMLALLGFIHLRAPASSWGYISQALIFHQVRKYLLLLDVRKEHVKFWRPQMLLMVANPRSGAQLIRFVNDLKKGGLFVLGHVEIGELDTMPSDPIQAHYNFWLSLVDKLNVKAFVDLTLSPSVRQGTQHLLRITGLGGMKPNTLVLGFYDTCVPEDYFLHDPAFSQARENDHFGVDLPALQAHFPTVRGASTLKALLASEYVSIISDAVKMHKNVCLARYFPLLDKERLFSKAGRAEGRFVDVWPLNLLRPDTPAYVDVCSLFLLQLACILTMVSSWRAARLRLFLCVESGDRGWVGKEEKLKELLSKLRIKASIQTVTWDHVVALHGQRQAGGEAQRVTDEYLAAVNALVLKQGGQVAVRFLYLPRPPADTSLYERYLEQLEILTRDLGPTLLVHGLTPVTCTEL